MLHKELENSQRKCEENRQKSVKTGYQGAGPLITKTKTMTVFLGQDMEESYENWMGWHTDIHPI